MERCKIKAAVRLRPANDRERHGEPRPIWNVNVDNSLSSSMGTFSYDHVFDGTSTNLNVYEEVGRPIIDAFLQGFNATLFAYGQTASGKTHTIMGDNDEPGMIPLALSDIFHYMETQSAHREFILRCAYLEIYNEVLTDLLDDHPGSGKKIKIKEDTQGRVCVQGMSEQRILNGHEAFQLLLQGEEARKFAATAMNDRSSRSHTIYRLTLESKEIGGDMVKVSVLHLVDLAGSEKAHHSADQQRFKEGVKINLSLLHLGIVMAKLSNGEAHIPFRESKLTRILESSIGGNAKTTIVCTVSPFLTEETMSTLKFASRAMQIQNEAQVNEVPTSQEALLKKLKKVEEENRQLRMKISDADHLEKEKVASVKLEAKVRMIPHHREKEKVWRRQTVCPSHFGQPDSPLLFSRFANEAFSPRRPSQNHRSSDRRMSFFPIVTAHRYSLASTEDEEEFSLHNICETSQGVSPGSFQLDTSMSEVTIASHADSSTQTCLDILDSSTHPAQLEQSIQTEDGCLLLDLIHCGVQTDEVEVLNVPIQLARQKPKQKVDISAQTVETMDSLREDAEADFRYQLEGMRQKYENMKQLSDFEHLEATVQLEGAKEEMDKLSVQNLELQRRLETSVSQSGSLRESLAFLEEENNRVKSKLAALMNETDGRLTEKDEQCSVLEQQIKELKTENDELKDDMNKRDLEVQHLKEKYYEAMELSKTLMEKCENAVLESEVLVHMREQLEDAHSAIEREIALRIKAEEECLEMNEKIKELKTENNGLKVEMDKREIEVQRLKEKSDEATELSKMLMEKCENALLESEMLAHMREQLEEANAAKEGEVGLRRMAEEGYLEMKEKLEKANAAEEEAVSLRRMAEEGFLEMKKQIEELKTENDELKGVVDKTGIEVQDLKEKLEEANSAKEEDVALRKVAEEGYLEMKEKMSLLEAEKVEAMTFRDITEREREQLLEQMSSLEAEKVALIQFRDGAECEMEQLLEQIKDLKTENDGLKVEMDKRGIEVQHLKKKSDEATELSKMLMEKCENALLESEMLAHMREQLEEANAAKEGEVALRRMAEEGYLEMKEKMSLLEAEKVEIIKFRDDTEREREQLLEQLHKVNADSEELKEEKRKMEENIASSTEAHRQSLSEVEQQIKEVKAENDGLKDEMDKRKREVQHLKEKYDEATELSKMLMEKCENALLESEMLAHMREQLEEANAAKEGEVALRRMAEEGYLEMKEKMSLLEAEKVEAIKFRDVTEREREQLLEQLHKANADNEELKEEKRKMEENIASNMEAQSLSEIKQQVAQRESTIERLTTENELLGSKCSDLESKLIACDGLSSSHAAIEQDLKSSKEESESLKKHLKRVIEMKRKMEWQRDDAGRLLDDLEEKMEEVTAENERLRQEAQAAKEQSDGLSSSHAALEQDIRSSKEECESLKKELKRVVEMKRKMEWQRDDAGRQLDDLEEKMEDLALERRSLLDTRAQALEQLKEVTSERDSIKVYLLKAEDRIAVLEGMEKENLPKSEPGLSASLAHADVEELRKKLKTITEMHQVMEQQRDEETRKVDKLREQIEFERVKSKQLSAENQKLKHQASTQQPGVYTQDPIGHGCGLSLEYETYQLRSQLGECKRREEKLNAICKKMQTDHRSTLVRKDREVQHLQRELERAQQQCETLRRETAPLPRACEEETASGPQRRVLLEQNITAEKKPAVVKPTAVASTIMPLMNRGGANPQPGKREQPAFEWDQTVHESQLESGKCNQQ